MLKLEVSDWGCSRRGSRPAPQPELLIGLIDLHLPRNLHLDELPNPHLAMRIVSPNSMDYGF